MTRLYAGSAAILVSAMLGASAYWILIGSHENDPYASCRVSSIAGGVGEIGGPFTLVNTKGETVTDAQVLTKPSLIYFGYTFCPDVCPFDNARNAEAADILEESGFDVTPVFITIDPKRDTPEVMGEYSANLHPNMIGLTGTEAQIKAVSQEYKTYYKAQPEVNGEYLMDHSTFTYLVVPGKGFLEFFRRDVSADDMATHVACFLDKS